MANVLYSQRPDLRHLTADALIRIDDAAFVSEQGTFCAVDVELHADLVTGDWFEDEEDKCPAKRQRDSRFAFIVQSAFRHRLLLLLARYIKLTYRFVAPPVPKPERRTRLLPRPLYQRPLAPLAPLAPPAA